MIESVENWHILINEIKSRLPRGNNSDHQPPLDMSHLNRYKISDFATRFLSRAQIPAFKYAAPNTTCLTPEQFASIYGSEPSNSRRLEWITLRKPSHCSTLLLPSQPVVESCDPSFEKDWGFEKFTVQRYGGIYVVVVMKMTMPMKLYSLTASSARRLTPLLSTNVFLGLEEPD
jgi:hypothetical protein